MDADAIDLVQRPAGAALGLRDRRERLTKLQQQGIQRRSWNLVSSSIEVRSGVVDDVQLHDAAIINGSLVQVGLSGRRCVACQAVATRVQRGRFFTEPICDQHRNEVFLMTRAERLQRIERLRAEGASPNSVVGFALGSLSCIRDEPLRDDGEARPQV